MIFPVREYEKIKKKILSGGWQKVHHFIPKKCISTFFFKMHLHLTIVVIVIVIVQFKTRLHIPDFTMTRDPGPPLKSKIKLIRESPPPPTPRDIFFSTKFFSTVTYCDSWSLQCPKFFPMK